MGPEFDYSIVKCDGEYYIMATALYEKAMEAAGKTATETVGNILIKIDPLLEELKPDAFLVLGDTNSCLCAIPAKKRHIPIFHIFFSII